MNGKQLLLGLGYISGKYIDEAHNDTALSARHKRPRLLLIAAIIALTALLMGCAAAILLNLDSLRIGQRAYVEPAYYNTDGEKTPPSEGIQSIISLQGPQGSPNQLANQEWFQFRQSYDPDHALWTRDFSAPPEYASYGLYTQEMVDKLAEICQKYGLKPQGRSATDQYADWEMIQTALGIDGFLKDGAQAEERYAVGGFYECGNFHLLFYLRLTDPASSWEEDIMVRYLYCGKEYFNDLVDAVDPEKAQQWNLTLEDGTELLLILDDGQARVLCDRADAFLSVSFETVWDNYADGTQETMSREDIERVARSIDYTLISHPVEDMDWVEARVEENIQAQDNWTEDPAVTAERKRVYEENECKDSYAQLVARLRDNEAYFTTYCAFFYEDAWDTLSYTLMDVTADGEEELLLSRNDKIQDIWTMEDGKTARLPVVGPGDLCEGNMFRSHNVVDGAPYYWFFDLNDGGAPIEQVWYQRYDDQWFHDDIRARRNTASTAPTANSGTTTTTIRIPDVAITEEEANKIIQSYTLIPLEFNPLKEFPLE